jgi:hypothetical protein
VSRLTGPNFRSASATTAPKSAGQPRHWGNRDISHPHYSLTWCRCIPGKERAVDERMPAVVGDLRFSISSRCQCTYAAYGPTVRTTSDYRPYRRPGPPVIWSNAAVMKSQKSPRMVPATLAAMLNTVEHRPNAVRHRSGFSCEPQAPRRSRCAAQASDPRLAIASRPADRSSASTF